MLCSSPHPSLAPSLHPSIAALFTQLSSSIYSHPQRSCAQAQSAPNSCSAKSKRALYPQCSATLGWHDSTPRRAAITGCSRWHVWCRCGGARARSAVSPVRVLSGQRWVTSHVATPPNVISQSSPDKRAKFSFRTFIPLHSFPFQTISTVLWTLSLSGFLTSWVRKKG